MSNDKIKKIEQEIEELEKEFDRQDNNPRWDNRATLKRLEKLRKELEKLKKGGSMKTLMMIVALMFMTSSAHAFEAENEPVTQAQFEKAQAQEKASSKTTVPSAKTLLSTNDSGKTYRMKFIGDGMMNFNCKKAPKPMCYFTYVSAGDTGFGAVQGYGTYAIECYKKKPCLTLEDAAGSDATGVSAIVESKGSVELSDDHGRVIKAPLLIVTGLE